MFHAALYMYTCRTVYLRLRAYLLFPAAVTCLRKDVCKSCFSIGIYICIMIPSICSSLLKTCVDFVFVVLLSIAPGHLLARSPTERMQSWKLKLRLCVSYGGSGHVLLSLSLSWNWLNSPMTLTDVYHAVTTFCCLAYLLRNTANMSEPDSEFQTTHEQISNFMSANVRRIHFYS